MGQTGISVAQGAGKKNLEMGEEVARMCAHVFTYRVEVEWKEGR